jgi:hypothetical protein
MRHGSPLRQHVVVFSLIGTTFVAVTLQQCESTMMYGSLIFNLILLFWAVKPCDIRAVQFLAFEYTRSFLRGYTRTYVKVELSASVFIVNLNRLLLNKDLFQYNRKR